MVTNEWLLIPAPRPTMLAPLSTRAPLAARVLHSALAWCSPAVVADVRRGRENSRSVRLALAQYAEKHAAPLLSRTEVRRGAEYLRQEGLG